MMNYIKNNWLALLFVLIPAGAYLGPLPYDVNLTRAFLSVIAFYSILKSKRVSGASVFFIIVCALSIVLGNANPLFKSWGRLGLFVILFLACFPVFQSGPLNNLRHRVFPIMISILLFTSIGSFFAFFMGINYMTIAFNAFADSVTKDDVGWFGGLTYQSMLLGPISALSFTALIWMIVAKKTFI